MKRVKPTEKQKAYVKGLTEKKSKRKAALDAGYSMSVANNTGLKLDGSVGVLSAMDKLRTALDIISEDDIAITIKHAMLADKSDMTGQIFPDHRTRLQAAETAAKYKGADPAQKHDVKVEGDMTINVVNFTGASKKDV